MFDRLKKPWFYEQPNEHGEWNENRIDADIGFWKNCEEANINVQMSLDVLIGHLELVVTWLGQDLKPVYQPINNWRDVGKPSEAFDRQRVLAAVRANPALPVQSKTGNGRIDVPEQNEEVARRAYDLLRQNDSTLPAWELYAGKHRIRDLVNTFQTAPRAHEHCECDGGSGSPGAGEWLRQNLSLIRPLARTGTSRGTGEIETRNEKEMGDPWQSMQIQDKG